MPPRSDPGLFHPFILVPSCTFSFCKLIMTTDIYVRIWLDVARGNKLYLLGYVLIGVSNCLFSGLTL